MVILKPFTYSRPYVDPCPHVAMVIYEDLFHQYIFLGSVNQCVGHAIPLFGIGNASLWAAGMTLWKNEENLFREVV